MGVNNSRNAFTDALWTPTYSVSVLAGNLGRISMSKQEIVWVLHSVHSQTTGQESASDTALIGRLTSVNNAHVITCMLGSCALQKQTYKQKRSSDCRLSLHLMVLLVSTTTDVCIKLGKAVYSLAFVSSLRNRTSIARSFLHRAARASVKLWRWGCWRTDSCSLVKGLEVVFKLRGGWTLVALLCSV